MTLTRGPARAERLEAGVAQDDIQGQPAPGQLAMVMRMQKIDGRWLVDQMTSPLDKPLQ